MLWHLPLNKFVKTCGLCLVILAGLNCLTVVRAQETREPISGAGISDRKSNPTAADSTSQADSPLQLSFLRRETSKAGHPVVFYELQNVSSRSIRAFVIMQLAGGTLNTRTVYHSAQLFAPGQVVEFEWSDDSRNPELPALTVDYVLFGNGSDWGKDTQKQRDGFAGNYNGRLAAIKEVRKLVDRADEGAIRQWLERKPEDTPIDVATGQSEPWRKGYRQGYQSFVRNVRLAYEKERLKGVRQALDEFEPLAH